MRSHRARALRSVGRPVRTGPLGPLPGTIGEFVAGAKVALVFTVALVLCTGCGERPDVVIGSKKFTESVLLAHAATQLCEDVGITVGHKRELGGTRLLWNALLAGEIDAYPEYTGTLRQEILVGQDVASDRDLRRALAERGVVMTDSLGFDNSYAIGMREETAERLGIRTVSDLAAHPEVTIGLGHEFLDRDDGWPAVKERYGITNTARGLDHALAYRALLSGSIHATDLYTTDPQIERDNLRVLIDDQKVFPSYQAVFLIRADLADRAPGATQAIASLEGRIDGDAMIAMNARAMFDRANERQVTADFLNQTLGVGARTIDQPSRASRIWQRTLEHLFLVVLSLLAAVVISVPLGVVCAKLPRAGQVVLGVVEAVQTVPSMALLVLFVPLLGIGALPALAAMFLYSLLPIVRSTATGLIDLSPTLRESAVALGLPPMARLRLVELPMAARSILAGIKTSAVWNVGTATIGALVGARGYGQPILSGIRLDDTGLILEGAIPAAAMALLLRLVFEVVERMVVPRGLRLRRPT